VPVQISDDPRNRRDFGRLHASETRCPKPSAESASTLCGRAVDAARRNIECLPTRLVGFSSESQCAARRTDKQRMEHLGISRSLRLNCGTGRRYSGETVTVGLASSTSVPAQGGGAARVSAPLRTPAIGLHQYMCASRCPGGGILASVTVTLVYCHR